MRGLIGHVVDPCVCSTNKFVDRESLAMRVHRPCLNPRDPRDPRMIPLQRMAETSGAARETRARCSCGSCSRGSLLTLCGYAAPQSGRIDAGAHWLCH
jgi:hypothetical protein